MVHAGKVFLVDQSYSVIGQVSAIRRRSTEFSNQSREEGQWFLSITPRENVKQCEVGGFAEVASCEELGTSEKKAQEARIPKSLVRRNSQELKFGDWGQ